MKKNEMWLDVKGYEGIYKISDKGRVKSFKNNKEVILKNYKNLYKKIYLYKNGKRKLYRVHRLVGLAFIPNHEQKPDINHKDGDKYNNNVENLEWVTHQENIAHARENNLFGEFTEKQKNACRRNVAIARESTKRAVVATCLKTGKTFKFGSISNGGRYLNVSAGHISEVCRGKRKTAKGFKWEYAEEIVFQAKELDIDAITENEKLELMSKWEVEE